ncbi:peptidyl-prolyl cis-trans isomerase C [Salmonella enterica subsp. enterica serovar Typhimurium]|nr:peptidyl-prolyl cis-trans isomerase C [Salmonella enterica subsp. enterica serovar Typhimurium]
MVPAFDKVVFSCPVLEPTGPLHTQFGYHIIKVLYRKIKKPGGGYALPGLHRLLDFVGQVSASAPRQGISTRYRNTLHIRHIARAVSYLPAQSHDYESRRSRREAVRWSTAPSGIALPRSPGCNSAINGFSSGTQA